MLDADERILQVRISSSNLTCIAALSDSLSSVSGSPSEKVTVIVPVLIRSCQVPEKWNRGPVAAQITISAQARTDARPAACEAWLGMDANNRRGARFIDGACNHPSNNLPAP